MASRKIEVAIVADATGYQRGLRSAGTETEGFGSKLGGVAKAGLIGFAGAVVGVTAVLGESVKAAMNAQVSQAALDAALKATHQSVAAMTPAIEEAAASGRKLGFSDEDTARALTKLEIATGNTKKSIADLSVAQDIARTKHIDLATASGTLAQAMTGSQRAAKQLGIIVQPVTAHMDALKNAHVDLTTASGKAEEAHAKLLDKMATGQAVIAATSAKVKGQAQAYADTAAGGMAQFHAQLESLQVTLGTALLPALTQVTQGLADGVAWLQQSKTAHELLSGAVHVLSDAFHTALSAIRDIVGFVRQNQTFAEVLAAGVGAVTLALAAYATAMGIASAATAAATAAQTAFDVAMDANPISIVVLAIAALVAGLTVLYEKNQAFHDSVDQTWNDMKIVVLPIIHELIDNIRNMATIVGDVATLIGDIVHGRWDKIWGDLKRLAIDYVKALLTYIGGAPGQFLGGAEAIGTSVLNGVVNEVKKLPGQIQTLLGNVLSFLGSLPGKIVNALGDLSRVLYHAGVQLIQGFLDGIVSMIGKVASTLGGIAHDAVSWKGPPAYDSVVLVDNGRRMMQGFQAGIVAELPNLQNLLGTVGPLARVSIAGGGGAAVVSATPASASINGGAGSAGHTFNFYGHVSEKSELVEMIRTELIRTGRRNGGNVLGGLA